MFYFCALTIVPSSCCAFVCYSKVLSIQILLRMNQFQLAEQKLQQLRAQDGVEDTSLYKLASCWLILQSGDRGKFQEAVYKYEELVDKYSKSHNTL